MYGSLRDLVIGVTLVLADGTVARSGGHVIKNVAGYDLAKLLHGSYGTLGRARRGGAAAAPGAPQRSATLALHCPLAEAAEHAATVLGGPYEPAALEWISAGDGTLLVRLEGTADALPRRAAAPPRGARRGAEPPRTTCRIVGWTRVPFVGRIRGSGTPRSCGAPATPPCCGSGCGRASCPAVLAALPASAVTAGLGTGIATVTLPPDAVADAHAAVHAAGGTSVLRARPAGADVPGLGPAAVGARRAAGRSRPSSTRTAASAPAASTPWM